MALKPARSLPELFDVIAPIALQFQTATIELFNPQTEGTYIPYDPTDDSGGYFQRTNIYVGQARIQQLSDSDRSSGQTMNPSGVMKFRFQIPLGVGERIERGWQIQVTQAKDQSLLSYPFVVDGGVNSSVAQVRDIFATVDLEAMRGANPDDPEIS